MNSFRKSGYRLGEKLLTSLAGRAVGYGLNRLGKLRPAPKFRSLRGKAAAPARKPLRPRKGPVKVRSMTGPSGVMTKSLMSAKLRLTPQVRSLDKVGAPSVYVNQQPLSLIGSAGFQNASVFSVFDQSVLSSIASKVNSTADVHAPTRFVMESVIAEQTFTNSTTAGIDLEIYDIVCKRDVPYANVITVPIGSTGANTYGCAPFPTEYWNNGVLATQGLPVGTAPAPYTILGSSPFDSPFFKDYFKVKKRTLVQLQQGASHRHAVLLKPNALIDNTKYSNASIKGFTGLTQFTMFVARGLPSGISGTTTCTSGLVRVDCINTVRYKYSWVQNNAYLTAYTDSLTTPAADVLSTVNIGSGAVDAIAEIPFTP